ncbi:MAG: nucleotide pyrophosphohydrolase [Deltaproteobacteria bacterium]|nr:nucleotide pyrophosphohydrolase [Deltaproteobacteria bacterium]
MISLQLMVTEFNQKRLLKVDRSLRVLDLSSEIGEVCKLAFSEGVGKKIEINNWEEELGDVLYSLLSLMSELDIEAEKALSKVLEKYQGRIANRNSKG